MFMERLQQQVADQPQCPAVAQHARMRRQSHVVTLRSGQQRARAGHDPGIDRGADAVSPHVGRQGARVQLAQEVAVRTHLCPTSAPREVCHPGAVMRCTDEDRSVHTRPWRRGHVLAEREPTHRVRHHRNAVDAGVVAQCFDGGVQLIGMDEIAAVRVSEPEAAHVLVGPPPRDELTLAVSERAWRVMITRHEQRGRGYEGGAVAQRGINW